MGAVELTFREIGAETMALCWPVFAAAAAIEVWLVRRIRRSGRFPALVIASTAFAVAVLSVALWGEAFLETRLVYETVGEGARADAWAELESHVSRTWPLLLPLGGVLLALATRPRSTATVDGLVAASGVLLSWIVAMWLFTTNHQNVVLRLLVRPGGLGVMASLVGFAAATTIWMAMGRWLWKEGRRRRRAPRSVAERE